ncbi:MAG TPA: leucyl/phenylalanyl-tRNA--protein transferase [Alphaproteobacteria bacterium]|nr:leucyl/phenylalanyl-tRNA--protein transferase [Alphaproteobacteria bacterium]
MTEVTPDLLLRAYAYGLFPMADSADSPELYWFDPPMRGILPLDGFRVSRSLRKAIRQDRFEIRFDTAFRDVVRHCAAPAPNRPKTWINDRILTLYATLHDAGYAHSVECWKDNGLVGGLYGVALKGAFFGESMFSHATDASKVALAYLVAGLRENGFALLDTQFTTAHLARFGGHEIPQADYKARLARALTLDARLRPPSEAALDELLR